MELFSLTDKIPTIETTIDRKHDSISNLSSFLDSLHFDKYSIKYTKQEK